MRGDLFACGDEAEFEAATDGGKRDGLVAWRVFDVELEQS